MRLHILTVLYKQHLKECQTYRTLLLPAIQRYADKAEVYVADNSPDSFTRDGNKESAQLAGIHFDDMKGNRGLPAAYNRLIDRIKGSIDRDAEGAKADYARDWILITDQDTEFPENYLSVLCDMAKNTTAAVLAPVVKSGSVILSPCRRAGLRFVPGVSANDYKEELRELFFINSGLAIRADLFYTQNICYDESLFLDFTDFDLISQIRAASPLSFALLPDVVVRQQFSGAEERTPEADLERYRQYLSDGRVFYKKWFPGNPMGELILRARGLRLARRHGDRRFLKKT